MASIQPAGMHADAGVVLTVGMLNTTSGDTGTIVLPMSNDAGFTDKAGLCSEACFAFEGVPLTNLLSCLSADTEVRFIAAEGMVNGCVPFRIDYAAGAKPGIQPGDAAPSQVAALITMYADPADLAAGHRMEDGRIYVPFVSEDDITGDTISGPTLTALDLFGQSMLDGWVMNGLPGKWWRVLKKVHTIGGIIIRTIDHITRVIVATQRRRVRRT